LDAHREFIEQRRSALENQALTDSDVVRLEQDTLDRMEKLMEDGNHINNMDAPEVAYARIKGAVAQARGKGQPVDLGVPPSGDGSKTSKRAKSIKTKGSYSKPKSSRSYGNNGAPPCEVDEPERIPSRSIIVVLDTSGSMSKRLAGAKAAISGFVSSLRPKTRVALRTFGGSALSFQSDKDECDDKKIVSVQARVDGKKKEGKKRLVRAVDELVSFDVTTKYDSCSSLDVLWDFGDGNVSNEKAPEYTYQASGDYDVTVKVVCDDTCDERQDHLPLYVANICGPDIGAQLQNVLADVRATFNGNRWAREQKEELCDAVRSRNPLKLHQTVEAWDICQLYLPYTTWLYNPALQQNSCGMPAKGEPGKRAIETLPDSPCGNSVEVNGHCYLAGTVNYALFGEISRLCHDEFQDRFDMREMIELIFDWKVIRDDPDPPIAWAVWAYQRKPLSDVPTGRAANRDYCELLCGFEADFTFSWRWLPYQRTCPRW
jgi:hypothetical protein